MMKYYIRGEEMVEILSNYYNDSRTKGNRRRLILESLSTYLVEKGILNTTFTDICTFLQIERKSLYRYYSSKEDIIVDIAFIVIHDINYKYLKVAKKIFENGNHLTDLELIKQTLVAIAEVMLEESNQFVFLNEFDMFYHNLDHQSPEFIRYQKIIANFKSKHHFIAPAVERAYKNKTLQDNNCDIKQHIDVLEQSLHAYMSRILIKHQESTRYKVELIYPFINSIVYGI